MWGKVKTYVKLLLELSIAGGAGYMTGGAPGAGVAAITYLYRNGLVNDTVIAMAMQVLSQVKK